MRGQSGDVGVLPLGDHFGRGGCIVAGDYPHAGKTVQKVPALADGLGMGVNFRQLLQLCAGETQQLVADAKAGAAHNGQVPPLKQIVHRTDRAVGAVFNGEYSKLAKARLHGGDHRLKAFHIDNVPPGQQPVAGGLGVSALHTLTGDKTRLGEDLIPSGERGAHLCRHLRRRVDQLRLPRPGELEQCGKQVIGVALLVSGFRRDPCQNLPLPRAVGNGQSLCALGGGNILRERHALQKKLQQFLVHRVNFFPNLRKFHFWASF
ncbi:hypothetical protein SDC9_106120 [bioreactor metagenome]|uniref:Uncharacterized protein n=1 Tax=bioreactor metagenome TaxID=1076179 RepID=A0A645B1G1_9ZZZZ